MSEPSEALQSHTNSDGFSALARAAIAQECQALWRGHRKLELLASTLAAPTAGFVVGLVVYLSGGSALVWSAICAGVLAAVLGTLIVLLAIYSYYRLVEAPRNVCEQNFRTIHTLNTALTLEKERNAKPQLHGKINCLEDDARLDQLDNDYDCFITLSVELRNSGTPTTTNPFSLDLLWENESHPGTFEPLDGYYVETYGREPGEERSRHAIRATELTEFPYDEEITTTNQKGGWARFSFGSLPPDMVDGGHLAKDVIIELTAFDNQRRPHTIYKDKMYEGVQRIIAGCGKIKKGNEFIFA